jgi:hypothetical protein
MSCSNSKSASPPEAAPGLEIGQFVLYAERSVSLGSHDRAFRGDIGVRSTAEAGFGVQLKVGSGSIIERNHRLISPSVSLGRDVTLGMIQTNQLQDNGIPLGSSTAFPAPVMPPLPLAPAPASGGPDVTVAADEVVALLPGVYGALVVSGTLLLNPGRYGFSSATLEDDSRVVAIAGDVQISIGDDLIAGRRVRIYPAFHKTADQLKISVSGLDGAGSRPTVSLGERSAIRALLAAPRGTICFADHVHATGAFAGFDIALGEHVVVEFQCGFPVRGDDQAGSQQLQGYFAYGMQADPSVAALVGPVPADTIIPLAFGLSVRDPQGLQTFIKQVSDPKSPLFRKHLTQAQFCATYGATTADYQALQDWATNSNGFTIQETFPNNLLLSVTATAAQVEQALFVNLNYRLRQDGSTFVAVDRDPSLNLNVPVLRISGLTEVVLPSPGNGTGGNNGNLFRAADLRNAYLGVASASQGLDGSGQVVGIYSLATFTQSDVAQYQGLQLPVAGQPAFPNPPQVPTLITLRNPFTGPGPSIEAPADVQLVYAMAPNAQVVMFAGVQHCTVLAAMANSTPSLTVASCSWRFSYDDNCQQHLDQMATLGVSFLTNSFDYGDVGDPQNNLRMNNQTLVGGTFLFTNPVALPPPTPTYPSPFYQRESTWNGGQPPKSKDVTGGGIMDGNNKDGTCQIFCGSPIPIPDYQVGVSMATNGGSTSFRNYPDVAMIASNLEIVFNGTPQFFSGTSASAPLWAGYMALVNQQSLANGAGLAGFLNPTLYDIGLTSGSADDLYVVCFNDIHDRVSNANGFGSGFRSVVGYDLCTGWGSPAAGLLYQLTTLTPLTRNQPLVTIRITIKTGHDDLRGNGNGCGTGATADIFLQDGSFFTVPLHSQGDPAGFANNSTQVIDNPVPHSITLTPSNGIAGVRINIQEHFSFPCTADNWDIAELAVSLFDNPHGPFVCQLNLVGTSLLQDGHIGLVRLSQFPGSHGVGTSTQIFPTGPGSGCP